MIHIYSYGKDSPMKLLLTDRQADLVNRFTRTFFRAQEEFLEKHGRHWNQNEPLTLTFNANPVPNPDFLYKEEMTRYNRIARLLTFQYKMHNRMGTPCREEDLYDDFLIKN